jgi:small-conductance mechanosensitive channel
MRASGSGHPGTITLIPSVTSLSHHWVLLLSVPAVLLGAVGLGYVLRRAIHRFRKHAKTGWGEVALAVLESLPVPIAVLIAARAVLEAVPMPRRDRVLGGDFIFSLAVVLIFYLLGKALIALMRRAALRDPALNRVTQPAAFVIRLVFITLASIIILENLGIHLTALWTTLGVGSVAVALGLQETFSNTFAGLYIMADQPVAPGDYVKLDSGQEGIVLNTGWRATSLRTLSNNIVYIPNSSLAKAVITNYSKPEERMSISIPVSVAYGSDARQVERILVEVARQAAANGLEGLLASPEPSARLNPGFGAFSLDFSLSVHIRRFVDQYLVQSELRKQIIDRLAQERIQMPYPTQTILLEK